MALAPTFLFINIKNTQRFIVLFVYMVGRIELDQVTLSPRQCRVSDLLDSLNACWLVDDLLTD